MFQTVTRCFKWYNDSLRWYVSRGDNYIRGGNTFVTFLDQNVFVTTFLSNNGVKKINNHNRMLSYLGIDKLQRVL